MTIPFDNTYARLPEVFYQRVKPASVSRPKLLRLNEALCQQLRIAPEFLKSSEGISILAGNSVAAGSEPIAQVYAGHQFGHFVPQLGDGRAILLGEVQDTTGRRYDLQLKGSGRTRFSRQGDGRATLGAVIREYIVSEAMATLGIPTTRALAAVLTGEDVVRERILPGAVLTRVASSHIRVGTFQYFAAQRDTTNVRALADYAIARHYPSASSAKFPYRAFYESVVLRLSELVVKWMLVGFIHGVLNTDNISISGETIDYGPCAFLDAYHPKKVFSSIDQFGRYAFTNQPAVMKWNLARYAEALIPLLADNPAEAVQVAEASLARFDEYFYRAYLSGMRQKLGLALEHDGDYALVSDLLVRMADNQADYTLTFRKLSEASADAEQENEVRALFADPSSYDDWAQRWRERMSLEDRAEEVRRAEMLSVNPLFIPRNHRIEAAIEQANAGQFEKFHTLANVLERPFDDQAELIAYASPPKPEEEVRQTFCGT